MKTKTDEVEKIVVEMLTENTGIHMLDSGRANGRAWQRNQGKTLKDWKKEPSVTWNPEGWYCISVFHYLTKANLAIDETCKAFNKLNVSATDWGGEFYGTSKAGQAYLDGLGAKEINSFNTYNGDSALSQVLQGIWIRFGDDTEDYLLLQIHQGADVRGGYTDARLFHVPAGRDEVSMHEEVYGVVHKKDGTRLEVSNQYDGVTLRENNGGRLNGDLEIEEGDKVELELMSY